MRDLSAPGCGRLSGVTGKSRPGRRRRGREAAALDPDQCRIASCVAVPVIVTRFAVERLGVGGYLFFIFKGLQRRQGLGGVRRDGLYLPPLHRGSAGLGEGLGLPGRGWRFAKRAAPSLRPDGGGEGVLQPALETQLSGEGSPSPWRCRPGREVA